MRRLRIPLLCASCVLLTGCPPDLSPWEVRRGPIVPDAGPLPEDACRATVFADAVSGSSGSCYYDEEISGQEGLVEYDCEGGVARVTFDGAVFTGTSRDGDAIDVRHTTRYDFTGGSCTWVTDQRITGTLSSGQLRYTYDEEPEPGQSGCASACTGSAAVEVRD